MTSVWRPRDCGTLCGVGSKALLYGMETCVAMLHGLLVNSRGLPSSCPWIIASGCSANAVINVSLESSTQLVSDLSTKYIELYGIA